MRSKELKITRIGNSRGVRLPADVLRRYDFTDSAVMVEVVDGILLRPKHLSDVKMSWQETAKAMAASIEDWSEWDTTISDGLEDIPWDLSGAAEKGGDSCPASGKSERGAYETI